MSAKQRAQMFHSLAKMMGAGLPLTKAAGFTATRAGDAEWDKMARRLSEGLAEGKSLTNALGKSLTTMERRMLEAAEHGGRLPEGFQYLADYYEMMRRVKATLIQAAVYPLLLLHVAVFLPTLVQGVTQGVPVVPLLLGAGARLYAVLGLLAVVGYCLKEQVSGSVLVDKIVRRIPVVGNAVARFALARWYAVMHCFIGSGQRMDSALRQSGEASRSAWLKQSSDKLAVLAGDGELPSTAMLEMPVFPTDYARSWAVAEETGTLDTESAQASSRSLQEASQALTRLAEWLPRLVYVIVAGFAVYQIFQIASGYMQLLENMIP